MEAYAAMSRPYCLPRFLPLDKTNQTHRLADQLGPGFPFTSAQWPWPLENDEPMQPIVQINLDNAGKLLGENIGDGLLQCWAHAMKGRPNHWDPLLRIIPKADMLQTMDSHYPKGAKRNGYKKDHRCEGLDGPGEWWTKPRVEWMAMGGMFPDPIEVMVRPWTPENLGFSGLSDALSFAAAIHQTGIPLTFRGCFDLMEGVRLGGYPDAGHIHLSEWLDWEPIQKSPLNFDNILATGGVSVIGKMRVDGCDGKQLPENYLFWRRGGGRW
ncbi:MAG: hypothetical protein PHH58_09775 [Rhodoferax sp.]|nr:hypothetical protein [Rhodoferax sp.]